MYQPHEITNLSPELVAAINSLPPEQVAAILSNCVFFFNSNECTEEQADSHLAISSLDTNRATILFSSALVAREVADVLRGEWDGVNAVIVAQADAMAIKTTAQLLELELGQEIEFCYNGQFCLLPDLPPTQIHSHLLDRPRSGKSILVS